jgi:hypothetical protein
MATNIRAGGRSINKKGSTGANTTLEKISLICRIIESKAEESNANSSSELNLNNPTRKGSIEEKKTQKGLASVSKQKKQLLLRLGQKTNSKLNLGKLGKLAKPTGTVVRY